MYKAKYVCRLCGGIDKTIAAYDENTAMDATINATLGGFAPEHGIPVTMHKIHACPDGSFGIADFQGFTLAKEGGE